MSKIAISIDGQTFEVELSLDPLADSEFPISVNGQTLIVGLPEGDKRIEEMEWIVVGGRPYELSFDRDLHWLTAFSGMHQLDIRDLEAVVPRPISGDGRVKAPIPGQITRILVEVGQPVEVAQPLVVLEAMKMENEIRAPRAGRVSAIHVVAGQGVSLHQVLAEIV